MELTWLEDFLAVLDEGGFSRAAEHRGVSQPTFSRRVRALEEWIGAALFDRDTHSVRLTLAGERFQPAAEEILGACATLGTRRSPPRGRPPPRCASPRRTSRR